MVLGKLKQTFNRWIEAEAGLLHRLGLSPNGITVLGLFTSLTSAALYFNWRTHAWFVPCAGLLLLLSGFFDALDGAVARLSASATAFGGFLDSLLDRYSDAAILIAVVLSGLCDPLWGLISLSGSLLVSYSRARAEMEGVKMVSIGLAERAERMILIALLSLISPIWKDSLWWGMVVLGVATHITVMQRAYYFYKCSRTTQKIM